MIFYGTIKFWRAENGWGVVRQDVPRRPDIFVSYRCLLDSGLPKTIAEGTAVKGEAEVTERGLRAVYVEVVR